jgi:photosystem II stability/assembly factor-like uncharacterized protein
MLSSLLWFLALVQLTWQPWESMGEVSLRGVAVSPNGAIGATGTGPSVWIKPTTEDAWRNATPSVPGVTDYRSVAMLNDDALLVASAGTPAVIMRSADLGRSWKTAYRNDLASAFINAVRFRDPNHGVAFGDPIDGSFLLLTTSDGGNAWNEINCGIQPLPGEAGFAASNGSVLLHDQLIVIGLGGRTDLGPARTLRSIDAGMTWKASEVSCLPSGPSAGIFAVASHDGQYVVVVGGDHKQVDSPNDNIAISEDGGETWRLPTGNPPRGFRSSIVHVPQFELNRNLESKSTQNAYWLATGPSGTDISMDGEDWRPLSDIGYHALHLLKDGTPIAVGSNGRIAVLKEAAVIEAQEK